MKVSSLISALLCLTLSTLAQKSKKTHLQIQPFISAGVSEGKTSSKSLLLQAGIKHPFKQFNLIAGGGVDYYGTKRSIPVFIGAERALLRKPQTPFLYGLAGRNFSWLKSNQKYYQWWSNSSNEQHGWYYEVGTGYQFSFRKKIKVQLAAGYSVKTSGETYFTQHYNFFTGEPDGQTPTFYKFTFRRWLLKLTASF